MRLTCADGIVSTVRVDSTDNCACTLNNEKQNVKFAFLLEVENDTKINFFFSKMMNLCYIFGLLPDKNKEDIFPS